MKEKSEKELALRTFFAQRNMTFKSAADKLGVHQSSVGNLVAGRVPFGKKVAHDWQEAFGLSELWLMTGEGDMLLPSPTHPSIINIDKSTGKQVAGRDNVNTTESADAIAIIKKQQEQMDRLLKLLEAAMLNQNPHKDD